VSIGAIDYKEAIELALSRAKAVTNIEIVTIDNSIGRVIAQDIYCQKDLPSFDNSAMDGFAIKISDLGKEIDVIGTVTAGLKGDFSIKDGSCYRIMTGAKVPNGSEAVVPIEMCKVSDDKVVLPQEIKTGANIRLRGEEVTDGQLLISKGTLISEAIVSILASQGIVSVTVFRRVRIAVVSSGDELREPWEEAESDEIYNSNSFGIVAMLKRYGYDVSYIPALKDSTKSIKEQLSKLKSYDLIVTSGGVSIGVADFMEKSFIENGIEILFHGIRVKPGHPTMAGVIDSTFVLSLPGNPLAAMLHLFILGIPVLSKISGSNSNHFDSFYAKNSKSFKIKPNKSNIVIGSVNSGIWRAVDDNKIGSGMITPLAKANSIAVIESSNSEVKEGEFIKVVPFESICNSTNLSLFNNF